MLEKGTKKDSNLARNRIVASDTPNKDGEVHSCSRKADSIRRIV